MSRSSGAAYAMYAQQYADQPPPPHLVCITCGQRMVLQLPPQSIIRCPTCGQTMAIPGTSLSYGGGRAGTPFDPFSVGMSGSATEIRDAAMRPPHPASGTVRTLGLIGFICAITVFGAPGAIAGAVGLIIGLRANSEVKRGTYASSRQLRSGIFLCALSTIAALLFLVLFLAFVLPVIAPDLYAV